MRRFTTICLALFALAFVASLSLAEPREMTQGKLVAVYPDKQAFVVVDNSGKNQKTFEMDQNGKVFVNDKPANLGDLLAGEQVQVKYEMKNNKQMATEVRCQRF